MPFAQIRSANLADLTSYRDLRLKALKDHPDTFGMAYEDAAAKDHEYWVNTLTFEKSEKEIYFAISPENDLIGMAGIYRSPYPKARHSASIWGVYVTPEWRGHHIAEALVNACLGWARIQQIKIVRLAVVTSNTPALRSYERCGFKVYGTETKAIFHDGRYYDEYLMDKDIDTVGPDR